MRGRKRIYDEPIAITLKCERRFHDIMVYLRASDTEVYMKGVMALIMERSHELTPEALELANQELRRKLKEEQEIIAMLERIIMDRKIQCEQVERKKKSVEVRHWDGKKVIVGVSE